MGGVLVAERPFQQDFRHPEPELQSDLHRPVGGPRAREIKSQKAQLVGDHRHNTNKGVKMGMSEKTGLKNE